MVRLAGVLEGLQKNGVLTGDEVSRWHQQLEEAEREAIFFGASLGFFVGGRRPSKEK